MKKLQVLIIILILSASNIYAGNYFTLIAQLSSTPSSFAFGQNNIMFAGTLGSGVYRSTNYGDSWVQVNSGLTDLSIYSLAVNSSGNIFAGTAEGKVFFSSNNGNTWIITGLNVNSKVKTIAINPSGHIFAGTNGKGIYRSINNGSSWVKVGEPIDIYIIAINGTGVLFAGTRLPEQAVYKSVDNGNSWNPVYTGEHNFNSLAINHKGYVYTATGNLNTNLLGDFIAYSKDTGTSWEVPSTFGTSSYGLVINSRGDLFLGRYKCVWVSTDDGENWVIESSGLEPDYGRLISYGINPLGYLYAGQEGGYVYRTTFTTIGIENLGTGIPVNYNLYQNYPNPFNPSTTIKFDVPYSSLSFGEGLRVRLTIYDVLGKEIAVLVNEGLKPGSYQVKWNASGYSSGVYYYKLVSGDFSQTRKMVLIK